MRLVDACRILPEDPHIPSSAFERGDKSLRPTDHGDRWLAKRVIP